MHCCSIVKNRAVIKADYKYFHNSSGIGKQTSEYFLNSFESLLFSLLINLTDLPSFSLLVNITIRPSLMDLFSGAIALLLTCKFMMIL